MLSEEQKRVLPERIAARLDRLNTETLESIGNIIREIGELRPSDIHKLNQLKRYGADRDKIMEKLSEVSEKNIAEIAEIFEYVAQDSTEFAEQFYNARNLTFTPYEQNTTLQQMVQALAKQTADEYVNMSRTSGFMTYNQNGKKVLTPLSKVYQDVIDQAVTAVNTGVTDYHSAMRKTLKLLADSGIRTKYIPGRTAGKTVDYASGYSRRLDTAVRQNILWGVKQTAALIQEQTGEEFGANGYEIDYHSNPRPSHADMAGKQYAIGEGREVNGVYYPSFDTVFELLQDYGCLHYKWSIILGISPPTYSEAELKRLKDRDLQTFKFEGKTYTGYEATQVQRRLETKIRHSKDRQLIAKAAGDDVLRRQEQEKTSQLITKYKEFSDTAGLPYKVERMTIDGIRKKKVWMEEGALTKAKNGDIIKNIEIPLSPDNVNLLGTDIIETINNTIARMQKDYTIMLDEISVERLGKGSENVPFQYQGRQHGTWLKSVLVINRDYNFGNSMTEFNKRIAMSGTAANNVEGLIQHELAHVMTFQNHSIAAAEALNETIPFVEGISRYADRTRDGAESLAEAFVKKLNGDQIPNKSEVLLEKYIMKWRK